MMSDGNTWLYRRREELLAGVSSGLLLALSFPPFPTRILSVIALVPLLRYFIVVSPRPSRGKGYLRRGFLAGYVLGLAFFLTLLYWVANLIPASSARMPWLLIPALVLLVLYLSCYTALFSLIVAFAVRRFGRPAIFAAPALWALVEIARSRGELGFSWGILSSSPVTYPVAVQGASLYGPFGLSMVIVFVNLLVAYALFGRSGRSRVWSAAAAIAVIAVHLGWGSWEVARFERRADARDDSTRVAVVQPNVDLAIKWRPEYRDTIFTEIEDLTLTAAARGVELIVFPETAAPVSMSYAGRYRRWLGRNARAAQADLLIGYVDHTQEGGRWVSFNAAGLFDTTGSLMTQYAKVNLLPFGERIPFSQYITALGEIDFGQANFRPGKINTRFHSRVGSFGVLICFESTFSDYTRRYIRDGARFLVNITNDGWFGSRRGPKQHAETAILRAVENRVTVLRAANTGISMIIDPVGRVRGRIGLDRKGIIYGSIDSTEGLTLYTRYGHLPFFVMALVNIAAALAAAVLSKNKRR
jgi:apolipoprotein N-acyltransferase